MICLKDFFSPFSHLFADNPSEAQKSKFQISQMYQTYLFNYCPLNDKYIPMEKSYFLLPNLTSSFLRPLRNTMYTLLSYSN